MKKMFDVVRSMMKVDEPQPDEDSLSAGAECAREFWLSSARVERLEALVERQQEQIEQMKAERSRLEHERAEEVAEMLILGTGLDPNNEKQARERLASLNSRVSESERVIDQLKIALDHAKKILDGHKDRALRETRQAVELLYAEAAEQFNAFAPALEEAAFRVMAIVSFMREGQIGDWAGSEGMFDFVMPRITPGNSRRESSFACRRLDLNEKIGSAKEELLSGLRDRGLLI